MTSNAAGRARAKAKDTPVTIYLAADDQAFAAAIRRLNRTGWAQDPTALSMDARVGDDVLDLLWQARQELYARLGVGRDNRDYLTLRWLPICGPSFVSLVRVLRAHCYLNRSTGELRELWFEDGNTLGAEMGVSRATFFRVLKRLTASHQAPLYKQFILRLRRRRYDATAQATRVTSNQYLVAMEDPLTPEDMTWVERRARELLHERRARGATQTAVAPRDADSSRTVRPQREHLGKDMTRREDESRSRGACSPSGLDRPLEVTLEVTAAPAIVGAVDVEADADVMHAGATDKHASDDVTTWAPPRTNEPFAPSQPQQKTSSVSAASARVQADLCMRLRALGDTREQDGARAIMRAFADAAGPIDCFEELRRLVDRRVDRRLALDEAARHKQLRGWRSVENPAAYYTAAFARTAHDATEYNWDLEALCADPRYALVEASDETSDEASDEDGQDKVAGELAAAMTPSHPDSATVAHAATVRSGANTLTDDCTTAAAARATAVMEAADPEPPSHRVADAPGGTAHAWEAGGEAVPQWRVDLAFAPIWRAVLQRMRQRVSAAEYASWLADTRLVCDALGARAVAVRTTSARDLIRVRYLDMLTMELRHFAPALAGCALDVLVLGTPRVAAAGAPFSSATVSEDALAPSPCGL